MADEFDCDPSRVVVVGTFQRVRGDEDVRCHLPEEGGISCLRGGAGSCDPDAREAADADALAHPEALEPFLYVLVRHEPRHLGSEADGEGMVLGAVHGSPGVAVVVRAVGDLRAPVRHKRRRAFAPFRPCVLQFPRGLRLCGFGGVHLGILPAFVDRVGPRSWEALVGHELLQAEGARRAGAAFLVHVDALVMYGPQDGAFSRFRRLGAGTFDGTHARTVQARRGALAG